MSDVKVEVKVMPGGGRKVVVTVPVEYCVSPTLVGDPVVIADYLAMEVAANALAERGYVR